MKLKDLRVNLEKIVLKRLTNNSLELITDNLWVTLNFETPQVALEAFHDGLSSYSAMFPDTEIGLELEVLGSDFCQRM